MLQDISPAHLYNHFDPSIRPAAGDPALVIHGSKVLVSVQNGLVFPSFGIFPGADLSTAVYLFSIDKTPYFLYPASEADIASAALHGFEMQDLRILRSMEPKEQLFAAYTGKHLADWYRDTQFCGRCATRMMHSASERAMCCPSCGYIAYPRIMPAVIVGVINRDRLLVTRYRKGYSHNALVAGFTEIGETLEETVAREVLEETGLHVSNIRYYKSQPWGSANDLLAGFYCDAADDEPIRMDDDELKFASWMTREELELQPDDISLTNEMMARFKNGEKC